MATLNVFNPTSAYRDWKDAEASAVGGRWKALARNLAGNLIASSLLLRQIKVKTPGEANMLLTVLGRMPRSTSHCYID